jgi:hypothetical protein
MNLRKLGNGGPEASADVSRSWDGVTVKTVWRARAFSLAGFLVGFGLLAAPLQAGAGLLSAAGVQTTASIAITIPTPVPTVPTVTVPAPPVPELPVVKLPAPPLPKPPVVKLPALPPPKPPVVKLPALPIPSSSSGPAGQVPAPTLPKLPSVKLPSPTLGGTSQATSTVSRLSGSSSHEGAGTTSATGPATIYSASGQTSAALLFLGGAFTGPLVAVEAATARALGGLSRAEQARAAAVVLSSTVRRLEGCLRYLPDNLRRVLELVTGVNAPIALSPEAVAEQLHVTMRRVSRLERLALRRLRLTALTHTCDVATPGSRDSLALSGLAVLVGEEGGPAGGIEAARYATSPSGDLEANAPSQGGHSLLGINNPSLEGGGMLLILALLAGVLLIGLLFADGLWPWPIHHEWRSRWIHRHPWNWHH